MSDFLRKWFSLSTSARKAGLRKHDPGRGYRKLRVEQMEERVVPSITVSNALPVWAAQGPGPITNAGNVELSNPGNNTDDSADVQVGAVTSITVNPGDARQVFIGTTAGGVWRTDDITATNPVWTPLTDQFPSLAINAVAFSVSDPTNRTIFAGTGAFSAGGVSFRLDSEALGPYRSTDGGQTWSIVGRLPVGESWSDITAISTGTGNLVLVATKTGVYRSTNNGNSFAKVPDETMMGLPSGSATSIIADPTVANSFFVGIAGKGVYRTVDGGNGLTWLPSNGSGSNSITGFSVTNRVVVAASGNIVYAALLSREMDGGVKLTAVWRSPDSGITWRSINNLDANPIYQVGVTEEEEEEEGEEGAGQGNLHFALVIDPANPNVFYVAGDAQSSPKGFPLPAYRVAVDTTVAQNDAWQTITLTGANGTAPHADSRAMVFANGTLLLGCDGGIYKLLNPNGDVSASNKRRWTSALGTGTTSLQNTEFVTVAYDHVQNAIIGGAQDNSAIAQIGLGNRVWKESLGGDGEFVDVQTNNLTAGETSIQYNSVQFLGNFSRVINKTAGAPVREFLGRNIAGSGGRLLTKVDGFDPTIQFSNPFVLNNVDQNSMLIGTSYLYESANRGDNLTAVGGLQPVPGSTTMPPAMQLNPVGNIGPVTAMVYGGYIGIAPNASLIYAGTESGKLYLRTSGSGMPSRITTYTGTGEIKAIVADPNDWRIAYVLTEFGQVWKTTDAGATAGNWKDLAAGTRLGGLCPDFFSMALVDNTATAGDGTIVVAGFRGVFRYLPNGTGGDWLEFGAGLPNTIVSSLKYDATDDLLLAGTAGRGAWTISSASTTVGLSAVLQIIGDSFDNTMSVRVNSNNHFLRDASDGLGNTFTFDPSAYQMVIVDALNGNDTITIEVPDFKTPKISILVNGQIGSDTLVVLGSPNSSGFLGSKELTFDGGAATDTVQASFDSFFDLSDSTLRIGSIGAVDLVSVESATLTGGSGSNNFTLTGWSGSTVLNGGTGNDTVTTVSDSNFTLSDTRLVVGTRPAVALASIEVATLDGGNSANTFTVSGWTGSATLDGRGGSDSYSVDFAGSGRQSVDIDDSGSTGSDSAVVSGTSSADAVSINSLGVALGFEFVSYDSDLESIRVNGLGSGDSFAVSPSGIPSLTIDGGTGTDTVSATADRDFVLSDSSLTVGSFPSVALTGIETANLTGGASANSFTVSDWTGNGLLSGQAGSNTVLSTKNQNAILTDVFLSTTDGMLMTLQSVQNATLSGGPSANAFTLTGWNGTATLDGIGGGDSYTVNLNGSGSQRVTVADTGPTGSDTATLNGTANADAFTVRTGVTFLGGELVFYNPFGAPSLEALTVNGLDAADTFDVMASVNTAIALNGGNPTNSPGDAITYRGTGVAELSFSGAGRGRISQTGLQSVVYTGIDECLDFVGVTVNLSVDAGSDANNGIADTFTLRRNGTDLQVFINSAMETGCLNYDAVGAITVNGSGDDDTLDIDNSGGLLNLSVAFNASTGRDALDLFGDTATPVLLEGHAIRAAGVGSIVVDPDGSGGPSGDSPGPDALRITYSGLETLNDVLTVARLNFFPTVSGVPIGIVDGASFRGFVTTALTGAMPTTNFANKSVVSVSAAGGSDTFNVDNPNAAARLTRLQLYGNELTGGSLLADDNAADTFNVRSTSVATDIFGQGGNDTVNVSSDGPALDGNLDGIRATLSVDAGTGSANRLIVGDFGGTANTGVVFTANSIVGMAPAAINYAATGGSFANGATNDGILIRGSNAQGDSINVRSTLAGSTTKIQTNGGEDLIDITSDAPGGNGSLDGILGMLTIDAGAGNFNRLIVGDFAGAANPNAVVSSTRVSGMAPADIDYTATGGRFATATGNNDGILIRGSNAGDDGIRVISTLAGNSTRIEGNGGNDSVVLGNFADSLDDILGTVSVAGGSSLGEDFLTLQDRGDTTANTYNLNAASFSRTGGPSVFYSEIERLDLDGGTRDNTYLVNSTGAGNRTTIRDGIGNASFVVQGDGLLANNDFHGNAGTDRFVVNAGLGITGTTLDLTGDSAPGLDSVSFNGRDGGDVATLRYGLGSLGERMEGLGQTVRFDTIETVNFDGRTGANALTLVDDTNRVYGSATDAVSGIVYRPTSAAGGDVRVNGRNTLSETPDVIFTNINTVFAIDGDGDGSGDRDALTVLGVSTTGRDSGTYFAETTSADGRDTFVVSDRSVRLSNEGLGILRSVDLGESRGNVTFSTLLVRGGNEGLVRGDDITADPSNRLNMLIDGMDSVAGDPGDRLDVTFEGHRSITRSLDRTVLGDRHVRITQDSDGASVGYVHFETVTKVGMYSTTPEGGAPHVRVYDAFFQEERFSFYAYDPKMLSPVRVSQGDINGDAIADIITTIGAGAAPHVKVFDGITGEVLMSFYAYDPAFLGGVYAAVGDTNADGFGDIVVGADFGGGPHVQVFSGLDGKILQSFLAYDAKFRGGVRVSVGDLEGDGGSDIVTATATGATHVRAFKGTDLKELKSFFAFAPEFVGGVFVGTGDQNNDHIADIIVGAGSSGGPQVRVISGFDGSNLADFRVQDPFAPKGFSLLPLDNQVRVGFTDINGDEFDDIIVSKGPGNYPRVKVYDGRSLLEIADFDAYDPILGLGVYVGGKG